MISFNALKKLIKMQINLLHSQIKDINSNLFESYRSSFKFLKEIFINSPFYYLKLLNPLANDLLEDKYQKKFKNLKHLIGKEL